MAARSSSFRLFPPATVLPLDDIVSVIDEDRRCWNQKIVSANFFDDDAQLITSIPLCSRLPPDRLVWHYSKHRVFSVKSAYDLGLVSTNVDIQVGVSNANFGSCGLWKAIWKLKVLSKIRVCACKACLDVLPVKANILKKKVPVTGDFHLCDDGLETIRHCLFKCEFPAEV